MADPENRCGCVVGNHYSAGPTACLAHPDVLAEIRSDVSAGRVLSTADARLATRAGLVQFPAVARSGFNDGVIYPPEEDGPITAVKAALSLAPSERFALRAPEKKQVLRCLVLLVDFTDNVGRERPSHYSSLLFDDTNPGSMRSFYRELSYGTLDVDGIVTEWIRADNPYSYYTAGESGTGNSYPRNTPGLLDEVLRKYCDNGTFADFDQNGDGFLDGLFLIHAGGGAEVEQDRNKRPNKIWSHKWTLPNSFSNSDIKAYAYFTAPEDGRLGVFAHEFGHFLGLPDLYDTSYRSGGIGQWCLMSGGSWNGQGNTPARMSAWCLSALGWISPTPVVGQKRVTMKPLEEDRDAVYRLQVANAPKEYILVENRQQQGRDAGLPGSGLAVWHIDETQADNTNPLAYRVALIQADGKRDLEFNTNSGDDGDLFPGSGGVSAVRDTSATHPHTRANDGTRSRVSITKIGASGGLVTATLTVGDDSPAAKAKQTVDNADHQSNRPVKRRARRRT